MSVQNADWLNYGKIEVQTGHQLKTLAHHETKNTANKTRSCWAAKILCQVRIRQELLNNQFLTSTFVFIFIFLNILLYLFEFL